MRSETGWKKKEDKKSSSGARPRTKQVLDNIPVIVSIVSSTPLKEPLWVSLAGGHRSQRDGPGHIGILTHDEPGIREPDRV